MAPQIPLFLFSFVFLSLISFCFSFSASLSTVAVSNTSNDTVTCALIPGRSNAISCYSFCWGRQFSLLPNVGFRTIAAGGGFVCAVRFSNSDLFCWDLRNSSSRRQVALALPDVSYLQVSYEGQVYALDSAGNLSCWRPWVDLPAAPRGLYIMAARVDLSRGYP